MYSTIVHPTDFSEASIPALKAAHELAGGMGSRLIVCFLAHPPLVASGDTLTDPSSGQSRDIAAELESLQPGDPGVQRELRLVLTEQSTRLKTLLGFLEEMGADLLVLGMHRRGGVAGWLGSSITEEVVRRAHCAVLVVKHDADTSAVGETSDESMIDPDTGD